MNEDRQHDAVLIPTDASDESRSKLAHDVGDLGHGGHCPIGLWAVLPDNSGERRLSSLP
jgi:hypothetical protein